MIRGEEEPDVDFLAALDKLFDVDEGAKVSWPEKAVTVGLPKGYDWQKAAAGTEVVPIKKVIQKPSYIKMARLSEKKVVKG